MKLLLTTSLSVALFLAPHLHAQSNFADSKLARDAERNYDRAMRALDKRDWNAALEGLNAAAAVATSRQEGALYWKAFTLNKMGRAKEALATVQELKQKFPKGKWASDAAALEMEAGKPVSPDATDDTDLKLMALTGLMNSDPDRAVTIIEKMLSAPNSPKVKEKALFVLGQTGSAKGREILNKLAIGEGNPDLREKALQTVALHGGAESKKILSDAYRNTTDQHLKKRLLEMFMMSGDSASLLQLAKTEADIALRKKAIEQLALTGASEALRQLYATETDSSVKQSIVQGFFLSGDASSVAKIAQSDKDPAMRSKAIQSLGLLRENAESTKTLQAIYASETDPKLRRRVLEAYFLQGNAKALVELAKREKDPEMKKAIVQNLSLMQSKEATDFLTELLNK